MASIRTFSAHLPLASLFYSILFYSITVVALYCSLPLRLLILILLLSGEYWCFGSSGLSCRYVPGHPLRSSSNPQPKHFASILYFSHSYLKKNLNAPRPSEHPPVGGKNVKTFGWDQ